MMKKKPTYEELEKRISELERENYDWRRAEEAARKSEKKIRALLNAPPDWTALIDPKGTILAINKVAAEMLGKSVDELVGACVYDFFPSKVAKFRRARAREVIRSGKPIRFSDEPDERIFDTTVYPVLNEQGAVEQLAVVAHEMTEQKRAEQALMASEAQKQGILDASVDRIRLVHPDMSIIWANKTTTRQLRLNPESVVGKKCHEVLVGRKTPCAQCPSTKALKTGKIEHSVIHRTPEKGAKREAYWDNYAVPIKDRSGRIVNLIQITRNITQQKKAEKALKDRQKELSIQRRSLQELNSALRVLLEKRDNDKRELEEKLLSNVKELVIPYAEKLKGTKLEFKQLAYLEILESNLNDIVSPFSRTLSSKYLSLTPTEIQVANMVKVGKTSQEIAELMGLSRRTVESHRDNIRKKLGLSNRKANLRSHLLSV